MTLTAHVVFTSDGTKHRAWNIGNGTAETWRVSWLPERKLTQDQAVAALNIAERVGTGWSSPNPGISDVNDWADELGMSAAVAVQLVADRRSWGCAVRYADLPWQHKSLLLLLGCYFDSAGVYHRPSITDLAKATSLAEQHIVDLLLELDQAGWFSWHAVTGSTVNAPKPERLLQPDAVAASPKPASAQGHEGNPPCTTC